MDSSRTSPRAQVVENPSSAAWDATDYPAIGDYAIIGDCRTAALVSRQGSIDWLCLPNFSGPSVFAALLDRRRGGRFALRPVEPFTVERRYVPDTNVLETTFHTLRGTVRVTDFMPIIGERERRGELHPQRELLRVMEGLSGRVEMEVVFAPRPDFARSPARLYRRGALGWACSHKDEIYHLLSDVPLEYLPEPAILTGRLQLGEGQRHYLSLTYAKQDLGVLEPLGEAADARLAGTIRWWQQWSRRCEYDGPYRDAVMRSMLTVKLLSFALSGAVVAAATSSLPEKVGGSKNWDYRFCWLRDASLTLRAFVDLGYSDEGTAFLDWLLNTTALTRPKLQVLYDVYGETKLPERELRHLEGYRHSQPVRLGNAAAKQLQLDIYGEVLVAAYDYIVRGGRLDSSERRFLKALGGYICKHWEEPDHGLWEVRGKRHQHTQSKVMCWAGLDALLSLHEQGHLKVPERRFKEVREAIRASIETHGYNEELGSYVGKYGTDQLDVSVLLMARFGYCKGDDPRLRATFEKIDAHLGRGALLYRYDSASHEGAPGEATFGVASYWAVDYLARSGRVKEARQRFEELLQYSNDLGLYSEETAPEDGALLGNFPQTYSHVGLVSAAFSIHEVEQQGQRATEKKEERHDH